MGQTNNDMLDHSRLKAGVQGAASGKPREIAHPI